MNNLIPAPPAQLAAPPPPSARRPNRTAVRAVALIGISLLSGFVFRTPPPEQTTVADAQPPAIVIQAPDHTATKVPPPTAEEPALHYLEAVNLAPEIQDRIWSVCREDPKLFCLVMAIANKESRFDADAIGDNGDSLGLMQIQPRWNQERINRLGVTDLMDPVQSAMVAVDCIDWIAERLSPGNPEDAYTSEMLPMAYNQGWWGAEKYWNNGTTSTAYSREVMGYFAEYLADMGVTE